MKKVRKEIIKFFLGSLLTFTGLCLAGWLGENKNHDLSALPEIVLIVLSLVFVIYGTCLAIPLLAAGLCAMHPERPPG